MTSGRKAQADMSSERTAPGYALRSSSHVEKNVGWQASKEWLAGSGGITGRPSNSWMACGL